MSLKEFNLSLIRQYKSGPYNEDFERSLMETLFETKDYEMIVECLENGFEVNQNILKRMIATYDLTCYQYLFQRRLKLNIKIAKYVKFDPVKWCMYEISPHFKDFGIEILHQKLEVFEYLVSKYKFSDDDLRTVYAHLIMCGAVPFLECLFVKQPPLDFDYINYMALALSPETIKWLLDKGFRSN